jgi:hypothetical protein
MKENKVATTVRSPKKLFLVCLSAYFVTAFRTCKVVDILAVRALHHVRSALLTFH